MLPLLDQLGLRALDERAFGFGIGGATVWLHDVGVAVPAGVELTALTRDEVQRCFLAEFNGSIEVDGLNRLVLLAGLTARQIEILRAYSRYLRQIGFPFSQQYIDATLARHAPISRLLTEPVRRPLRPGAWTRSDGRDRRARRRSSTRSTRCPASTTIARCAPCLALIDATVRTNAFRPSADGGTRPVVAFKFDTSKVPDLPLPRPMFEILVCSPRVEGVHLRNGRIARGGLRWSDRREDFRTEVLGLVKAQMVKNAVIVPTGAKGGFVVKRPPASADDAPCRRASAATAQFVSGLLDLTDNIVGGVVVPPPDTVRHDGDDPYLVVAADKGTATFSDIANEIAAEYGFWLGDAFASGGSDGYDHKAMGITATGRVGERAPPRSRPRQGRRPRRADRRRHRRHVGRRVRQRHVALAARQARRRVRPSAHLHRSRSPIRRCRSPSAGGCSSCPARAGPTTTRR